MDDTTTLKQRLDGYRCLHYVFNELPTAALVDELRAFDWRIFGSSRNQEEGGPGMIASFFQERTAQESESIATELAIERVKLFRGHDMSGPVAPYESLYRNISSVKSTENLALAYRKTGFIFTGSNQDSPEYIGTELAFVSTLLSHEIEARETGDAEQADAYAAVRSGFENEHFIPFATAFGKGMLEHATTGFYRGFALLLLEIAESGHRDA